MFRITIPSSAAKKVLLDLGMALYYNCSCIRIQNIVRKCGGTAYTADLKSAGESLRVQIPPFAPNKNESYDTIGIATFVLFFVKTLVLQGFSATGRKRVISLCHSLALPSVLFRDDLIHCSTTEIHNETILNRIISLWRKVSLSKRIVSA